MNVNMFLAGAGLAALAAAAQMVPETCNEGFVSVFNGKDLSGWQGSTNSYYVQDGVLYSPEKGGGNLCTAQPYDNFIYRFEFQLTTNANNGIGIRMTDINKDAAYHAMCELQVLDNTGDKYKHLKEYQYHGSIYGIVAAKQGALKPVGQWNFQEIRVIGPRITVILNGQVITDADTSTISEPFPDGKAHPGFRNTKGFIGFLGHGSKIGFRNMRVKSVPADYAVNNFEPETPVGFTRLYNGKDLTNWKGVTTAEKFDSPLVRQAAAPEKRAEMQAKADELMRAHWHPRDNGALFFDGIRPGYSLATAKDYRNFEMYVDWRLLTVRGDSGIYLRGSPQVQIWDAHNQHHIGSGGLYNNKNNPSKALVIADALIGDWNRFYIKMVGDKVTVKLNGQLVVDNVTLENYWKRDIPIFPCEQIELQCHGDPIEFKNIFIKELP